MSLSLEDFIIAFPDFSEVDENFVQTKLDEADRQIDRSVWGAISDDGQGYLAAHLLAISPMGNAAKLSDGEDSTWGRTYRRMMRMRAAGLRTT